MNCGARTFSLEEQHILGNYRTFEESPYDSETTPPSNVLTNSMLGKVTALLVEQHTLPVAAPWPANGPGVYAGLRYQLGAAMEASVVLALADVAESLSRVRRSFQYETPETSMTSTSTYSVDLKASSWYSKFKQLAASKRTREALDELFNYVEDALDSSDVHRVGSMLSRVKPSDISAEMLISVLRATGRAKTSLPVWKQLLEEARGKVAKEGLPPRVLRGL
ncbi:hypothetical protein [Pseudomonas sp. 21]|uniref:hypothetical protein n=1 Tax=Pseudomonas sp. 21 TaxID=1619948 RepID=UPI000A822B4F|nr:hypothetical protein [Pseudomonas sp. 21]